MAEIRENYKLITPEQLPTIDKGDFLSSVYRNLISGNIPIIDSVLVEKGTFQQQQSLTNICQLTNHVHIEWVDDPSQEIEVERQNGTLTIKAREDLNLEEFRNLIATIKRESDGMPDDEQKALEKWNSRLDNYSQDLHDASVALYLVAHGKTVKIEGQDRVVLKTEEEESAQAESVLTANTDTISSFLFDLAKACDIRGDINPDAEVTKETENFTKKLSSEKEAERRQSQIRLDRALKYLRYGKKEVIGQTALEEASSIAFKDMDENKPRQLSVFQKVTQRIKQLRSRLSGKKEEKPKPKNLEYYHQLYSWLLKTKRARPREMINKITTRIVENNLPSELRYAQEIAKAELNSALFMRGVQALLGELPLPKYIQEFLNNPSNYQPLANEFKGPLFDRMYQLAMGKEPRLTQGAFSDLSPEAQAKFANKLNDQFSTLGLGKETLDKYSQWLEIQKFQEQAENLLQQISTAEQYDDEAAAAAKRQELATFQERAVYDIVKITKAFPEPHFTFERTSIRGVIPKAEDQEFIALKGAQKDAIVSTQMMNIIGRTVLIAETLPYLGISPEQIFAASGFEYIMPVVQLANGHFMPIDPNGKSRPHPLSIEIENNINIQFQDKGRAEAVKLQVLDHPTFCTIDSLPDALTSELLVTLSSYVAPSDSNTRKEISTLAYNLSRTPDATANLIGYFFDEGEKDLAKLLVPHLARIAPDYLEKRKKTFRYYNSPLNQFLKGHW